MPSAGLEAAIPATKRQQIYALNYTATGIGLISVLAFVNLLGHLS